MAVGGELVDAKSVKEGRFDIIENALKLNNWRRQPTATMLGIDRTTLFKKMRVHGLLDDDAQVAAEQVS